jgi:hypothetical protein
MDVVEVAIVARAQAMPIRVVVVALTSPIHPLVCILFSPSLSPS